MNILPTILLVVCTIILGVRLSLYIDTIGGSKTDKMIIVVAMFGMLLAANFVAGNIVGQLIASFR